MEEGKQKKSRKTDDEAEIGQRQFNSDSVSARSGPFQETRHLTHYDRSEFEIST